uniref:Uncharacterized protein n=1 Tax=Arundo donax TaxID=35708 RepID=A0A0A9FC33_ARUDO
MLSNCCALEWLSVVHCNTDGELKVHSPLPCLLFLNITFCELTDGNSCHETQNICLQGISGAY